MRIDTMKKLKIFQIRLLKIQQEKLARCAFMLFRKSVEKKNGYEEFSEYILGMYS